MKNELNQDWDNLLNGKSASQQLEIFMNIINEAKSKYVPRTNSKAKSNAKKHKFIPLDDKTIKKSRRNIDVGKDTWRPRIVLKLLQDLNVNKSPCPDGLHPKMHK